MPTDRDPAAWALRPFMALHLERQQAASLVNLGPGERTKGVCNHIRKELSEIDAKPDDVVEYADVAILAFDGAMRAGHSPRDVSGAFVWSLMWGLQSKPCATTTGHLSALTDAAEAQPGVVMCWAHLATAAFDLAAARGFSRQDVMAALIEKQARNELRTWPDWRTLPPDAPIEHVKEPSAEPVVSDGVAAHVNEFLVMHTLPEGGGRISLGDFIERLKAWLKEQGHCVCSLRAVLSALKEYDGFSVVKSAAGMAIVGRVWAPGVTFDAPVPVNGIACDACGGRGRQLFRRDCAACGGSGVVR